MLHIFTLNIESVANVCLQISNLIGPNVTIGEGVGTFVAGITARPIRNLSEEEKRTS